MRRPRRFARLLSTSFVLSVASASAATLPEHGPLSVLIVSDAVNPHNLTDAELTQPGDISAALNESGNGLTLTAAGAVEVSSQCVDDALENLEQGSPDVLIYFAHRGAMGCDGSDQQARFTAAVEGLLQSGGGLVVFHHGTYQDAAKQEILALIGVSASSIELDRTTGQRVYNLAPGHFVTTNGVSYDGNAEFAGTTELPSGSYEYFDNIPDERYPQTTLSVGAADGLTLLFATDSGPARVLGYALQRDDWTGRVVVYQPGEWQPNALDDKQGPNFQVLANAIVFAAGQEAGGGGDGGAGGASPGGGGGSSSNGGASSGGGGGNGAVSGGGGGGANAGPSSAGSPIGGALSSGGESSGGSGDAPNTNAGSGAGGGGSGGNPGPGGASPNAVGTSGGGSSGGRTSAGVAGTAGGGGAGPSMSGRCSLHSVRPSSSRGAWLFTAASIALWLRGRRRGPIR